MHPQKPFGKQHRTSSHRILAIFLPSVHLLSYCNLDTFQPCPCHPFYCLCLQTFYGILF